MVDKNIKTVARHQRQQDEDNKSTLQMFTGNYRDLAGKICNIYGKGL